MQGHRSHHVIQRVSHPSRSEGWVRHDLSFIGASSHLAVQHLRTPTKKARRFQTTRPWSITHQYNQRRLGGTSCQKGIRKGQP
jgi:hypothetical protein